MRPWTRLQDWGALLAGLYAALSPIWVSTTGEHDAFWALIVLGALVAVGGRDGQPADPGHQHHCQHRRDAQSAAALGGLPGSCRLLSPPLGLPRVHGRTAVAGETRRVTKRVSNMTGGPPASMPGRLKDRPAGTVRHCRQPPFRLAAGRRPEMGVSCDAAGLRWRNPRDRNAAADRPSSRHRR